MHPVCAADQPEAELIQVGWIHAARERPRAHATHDRPGQHPGSTAPPPRLNSRAHASSARSPTSGWGREWAALPHREVPQVRAIPPGGNPGGLGALDRFERRFAGKPEGAQCMGTRTRVPASWAARTASAGSMCAVPGMVKPRATCHGEHPATPQGRAVVEKAPAAPVVRGHERHAERAEMRRLPPVQLGDRGEATPPEPPAEPAWGHHRSVPGQRAHGRGVQVVVVVVADQQQVQRR